MDKIIISNEYFNLHLDPEKFRNIILEKLEKASVEEFFTLYKLLFTAPKCATFNGLSFPDFSQKEFDELPDDEKDKLFRDKLGKTIDQYFTKENFDELIIREWNVNITRWG